MAHHTLGIQGTWGRENADAKVGGRRLTGARGGRKGPSLPRARSTVGWRGQHRQGSSRRGVESSGANNDGAEAGGRDSAGPGVAGPARRRFPQHGAGAGGSRASRHERCIKRAPAPAQIHSAAPQRDLPAVRLPCSSLRSCCLLACCLACPRSSPAPPRLPASLELPPHHLACARVVSFHLSLRLRRRLRPPAAWCLPELLLPLLAVARVLPLFFFAALRTGFAGFWRVPVVGPWTLCSGSGELGVQTGNEEGASRWLRCLLPCNNITATVPYYGVLC